MSPETIGKGRYRGQGITPSEFIDKRLPYTQFQTWLADTSGSVGCPIDCKYCFLQLDEQTPTRPQIHKNPQELLDLLKETPTYHPEMPINFGSETDVFSTKQNIEYYLELLTLYGESDYQNPIVFISKRSIPDSFIELASRIEKPVVFYMSYSGLAGTDLEPNVRAEQMKDNFVRLKHYGLPRVHYWRPFLPQNSTPEKIGEIFKYVSKYATCSNMNGLRLNAGIRVKIAPFWPELMDYEFDFTNTGEVWPEGVRSYLSRYFKEENPDYPVFFGNTPCSLAYALEVSDTHGFYNGRMCRESQCPIGQRGKCKIVYQVPTLEEVQTAAKKMDIDPSIIYLEGDRVVINGEVDSGRLVFMRTVLKFPVVSVAVGYREGYNWANVQEEGGIIEIPWKGNWISGETALS